MTERKEPLQRKTGRLLVGQAVRQELVAMEKLDVALQVKGTLLNNSRFMRLFSESELMENMDQSRFVLRLSDDGNLLGCAQYWRLTPDIVEVGSWIANKDDDYTSDTAEIVMREAAQLAHAYNPENLVVALIHGENVKAKKRIRAMGGVSLGFRPSNYVKDGDKPAQMEVFHLHNLL